MIAKARNRLRDIRADAGRTAEAPAGPRRARWSGLVGRADRHNGLVDYELDDDPARVPHGAVWEWLSTEAYWGRHRTRADVETQITGA